ncbi:NAD-dependent histone deacetylase sir2 [Coemansia sp. RSA 552]|nr:NAD-dependent histone deacetylase sir2 [Coemansia sp. RSA 552]
MPLRPLEDVDADGCLPPENDNAVPPPATRRSPARISSIKRGGAASPAAGHEADVPEMAGPCNQKRHRCESGAADGPRAADEDDEDDDDEDDGADYVLQSHQSGSDGEGDEDLNIDGSYAPSPLTQPTDVPTSPAMPHVSFTDEQKAAIKEEAYSLGLNGFLQEYVIKRSVSVRSLLEVFAGVPLYLDGGLMVQDIQLLPLLQHQLVRFYRNRPKLAHINTVDDVVRLLQGARRIMVLTGAGVSVSCGIPDFRSPTGIYTRLFEEFGLDDPQQMFDIEYFREMPSMFYSFAKELYPYNFTPAPSHAFVKLLEDRGQLLRNYTQNIDTLEHVQGIENVLNCHGSFATATCIKCGFQCDGKALEQDIMDKQIAYCPHCKDRPPKPPPAPPPVDSADGEEGDSEPAETAAALLGTEIRADGYNSDDDEDDDDDDDDDEYGAIHGIMKPDITFFGEKLPDQFDQALLADREKTDLLLVMGSSLKVAPVSDIMGHLPHTVPQIVINKTPILHFNFDVQLLGDADDIVAYLSKRCGWDLAHERIRGGHTDSSEFVPEEPIPEPPSITVPIKKATSEGTEVEEKTLEVPAHWHLFPSAVVTGKDLLVANGESKLRLAVDSSDEDDDSEVSDGGESNSDDNDEEVEAAAEDQPGGSDSSERLAQEVSSKATV